MSEQVEDVKKGQILDAAFEKFLCYGLNRTSMSDIAEAVGVSRPALYLHYPNKEAIFAGVLERLLHAATTAAISELTCRTSLQERLDGFLQRSVGDLTERLRNSGHGADLVEAKTGFARHVVEADHKRSRSALTLAVKQAANVTNQRRVTMWVDMLLLAPLGFKQDNPTMRKFRERLSALATLVAGEILQPGTDAPQ